MQRTLSIWTECRKHMALDYPPIRSIDQTRDTCKWCNGNVNACIHPSGKRLPHRKHKATTNNLCTVWLDVFVTCFALKKTPPRETCTTLVVYATQCVTIKKDRAVIVFTVTQQKIKLETVQKKLPEEEAKNMKCCKRLIHKQFVQVSGLYGP